MNNTSFIIRTVFLCYCFMGSSVKSQVQHPYSYSHKLNDFIGQITYDSFFSLHEAKKLIISSSLVDKVEKNALCASPFKEIELVSNLKFPTLSKNHFGYCPSLKSLKIIYNNKMELEETVFSGLANLEVLEVVGQEMKHLTSQHLKSLNALEDLTLTSCGIRTIEDGAFDSLQRLNRLNLQRNKLVYVDELFRKLGKLRQLYLDGNLLRSFPWNDLRYLQDLEILSVGSNKIVGYNVGKIAEYCPKLREFYFRGNIFQCKKLRNVVMELKESCKDLVLDYEERAFKYCAS